MRSRSTVQPHLLCQYRAWCRLPSALLAPAPSLPCLRTTLLRQIPSLSQYPTTRRQNPTIPSDVRYWASV
eukprot:3918636-Rhodomonas_salina.3